MDEVADLVAALLEPLADAERRVLLAHLAERPAQVLVDQDGD